MLKFEKCKSELEKYGFIYDDNVVVGHSVAKVNWILPVGPVMVKSAQQVTSYIFGFTKEGIHIFPVSGNWNVVDHALIPWNIVEDFSMKSGLLENTMKITTNEMKVVLKINKTVAGNSWVKENMRNLQSANYFRK